MAVPKQLARFVLAVTAALGAAAAAAQTAEPFPSRAVRIIVPFPPGGGTDIVSRVLGAKLSEAGASRSSSRTARRGGQHRHRGGREGGARRLHAVHRGRPVGHAINASL